MVEVGIIGVGVMGAGHARYLTRSVPAARVAGIYDLDRARAEEVAAEVGATVADDPDQLIAGGSLDGVLIASPDATHSGLALACLRAGLPALVEKPLATNPDEARRVVEVEGESRLISVGFMRRFDPQHRALRQAAADGSIGRPLLFRSIHRNPAPPPDLTPRLIVTGSAIHDLDMARWLVGDFEAVRASGRSSGSDGKVDLLLIEGHHAGGALSTIEVFVAAGYGYEVTAELVGTGGVTTTLAGDLTVTRQEGAARTPFPQIWLERFEKAYIAELTAWVRSISGGEPFPGASAADGYADQVVAEAVMEAVATGRRVPVVSLA